MSKILWAFKITPIVDPNTGKSEPPNTAAFSINGQKSAFMGGAVRVAYPFKVNIEPRSKHYAEVIAKEYAEIKKILSKYESDITANGKS